MIDNGVCLNSMQFNHSTKPDIFVRTLTKFLLSTSRDMYNRAFAKPSRLFKISWCKCVNCLSFAKIYSHKFIMFHSIWNEHRNKIQDGCLAVILKSWSELIFKRKPLLVTINHHTNTEMNIAQGILKLSCARKNENVHEQWQQIQAAILNMRQGGFLNGTFVWWQKHYSPSHTSYVQAVK
jgi:hypothetical protein